jgi:hypothetical protein
MGSRKASMPMKCMDQMPKPIALPPPSSQSRLSRGVGAVVTRLAMSSAVNDASMATSSETTTNHGVKLPISINDSPWSDLQSKECGGATFVSS